LRWILNQDHGIDGEGVGAGLGMGEGGAAGRVAGVALVAKGLAADIAAGGGGGDGGFMGSVKRVEIVVGDEGDEDDAFPFLLLTAEVDEDLVGKIILERGLVHGMKGRRNHDDLIGGGEDHDELEEGIDGLVAGKGGGNVGFPVPGEVA